MWLRDRIVACTRAAVPYLSGTTSEFRAVIELASRVPIAVGVLHEQIVAKHAARQLLLDRILDPLIETPLRHPGSLPFGIQLSSAEIELLIRQSIPPAWFAHKTWVVLSALSRYLGGEADEIAFTIPLVERNVAAGRLLTELVRSKLEQRLGTLPSCEREQVLPAPAGAA